MKIALVQINPMVGDIQGNCKKIIKRIEEAAEKGASLAVFPELCIVGYPPRDLLHKPEFVRANIDAVHEVAKACQGIAALIGFVDINEQSEGLGLRNAVAYCVDGQVREIRYKSLLPSYDVFDEMRYFEPGPGVTLIEHEGVSIGVSICEDLWNDEQLIGRQLYHSDPIGELASAGARFLINMAASPFVKDKQDFRVRLFGRRAAKHQLPVLFINQVGGNDELLFDGASAVFDEKGDVAAQAKAFEEDVLVVDMDAPGQARKEIYPATVEQVHNALVMGMRDYVNKCGFQQVVLGLSGGIDSAVTAAIAVEAFGADKVTGVAMPSRYSSEHSIEDARELATNLGVQFKIIPIDEMHQAFDNNLQPHFIGLELDVTEENIQARIRGVILMALSNKFRMLLLATGNKSEIAVGYCTLYGDMAGGLAPLGDAPKSLVYELAAYVNKRAGGERIPQRTISKPPSAELRPDQTDQESLPPYEQLDVILEQYITEEKSVSEIIAAGFDEGTVREIVRMVDINEYKRKQAAPVLKITSRAFGTGRRMPIAARFNY
jgi:NAD+ synthase (glutamine-hydrolysing)